jgi:hypothetical protein
MIIIYTKALLVNSAHKTVHRVCCKAASKLRLVRFRRVNWVITMRKDVAELKKEPLVLGSGIVVLSQNETVSKKRQPGAKSPQVTISERNVRDDKPHSLRFLK